MTSSLMLRLLAGLLLVPSCVCAAEIGTRVADFRLADSAGRAHTLAGYSGKTVVVAFWSFKCPVALTASYRLAAIEQRYASRGVVVIGVASNANETAVEIRRNAANLRVSFPILLDSDGILAQKIGATHTPSVFVIDPSGVLRYQGGLDAPRGFSGGSGPVEESLEAILAGRPVTVPETPAAGCTIRRR